MNGPIGVFDSGYGGLTVLKEMTALLPQYDYLYLGDNARAPYGTRSFESVYAYTRECVFKLFDAGCPLVILACNTASAKALRTIQQKDLPKMDPRLRVLGVIRPTAEVIGNYTSTGKVGVLGTRGTILSESYPIEIGKTFPQLEVHQQACPMWVPLIENNEHLGAGADYFVKKYVNQLLDKESDIDTILLGCTHYPLLADKIAQHIPAQISIVSQGEIVAASLKDYLNRHPEMEHACSKDGSRRFLTTDDTTTFDEHASIFFGSEVKSEFCSIPHVG
ncbi:MAG: glutamate racemase [Flavobacteriales bacterium]|jgi:glutamate racemase|nr:glutamate racemase [Flavobacteriales bacterium]